MKAPENDRPVRGSDPNNAEPIPILIPMLAEKYHGKRALDAAEWIGDALWWFICHGSPDEDFTAEELIPAMAEDGALPSSSAAEVFPFLLELAATLADFALTSLSAGPPPNEYEEQEARSALKLILGDWFADFIEPTNALNKKETKP